jgi:cytochrome oxidase Cu insertion factor (SCO1/SenC/PrrC family)
LCCRRGNIGIPPQPAGGPPKKQAGKNGEDYLMEHSAFVYVVNPAGNYATLFSPRGGQGPDPMALRLRELIAASSRY